MTALIAFILGVIVGAASLVVLARYFDTNGPGED